MEHIASKFTPEQWQWLQNLSNTGTIYMAPPAAPQQQGKSSSVTDVLQTLIIQSYEKYARTMGQAATSATPKPAASTTVRQNNAGQTQVRSGAGAKFTPLSKPVGGQPTFMSDRDNPLPPPPSTQASTPQRYTTEQADKLVNDNLAKNKVIADQYRAKQDQARAARLAGKAPQQQGTAQQQTQQQGTAQQPAQNKPFMAPAVHVGVKYDENGKPQRSTSYTGGTVLNMQQQQAAQQQQQVEKDEASRQQRVKSLNQANTAWGSGTALSAQNTSALRQSPGNLVNSNLSSLSRLATESNPNWQLNLGKQQSLFGYQSPEEKSEGWHGAQMSLLGNEGTQDVDLWPGVSVSPLLAKKASQNTSTTPFTPGPSTHSGLTAAMEKAKAYTKQHAGELESGTPVMSALQSGLAGGVMNYLAGGDFGSALGTGLLSAAAGYGLDHLINAQGIGGKPRYTLDTFGLGGAGKWLPDRATASTWMSNGAPLLIGAALGTGTGLAFGGGDEDDHDEDHDIFRQLRHNPWAQ